MTVTSTTNFKEYQADGIATTFAIPFLLLSKEDLKVYLDNQLITAGYTINGLGNPISEIVFDTAPIGRLLLQRNIELIRETDYQENGDLLAKTVNKDFDRIYLAMQGFAQTSSQTLRVKDASGINALPSDTERANKLLGFDSNGQPVLTTIESGTALELAQALADSSDSTKGAGLIGFDKNLKYPDKTIGQAIKEADSVAMFTTEWWPDRNNIKAGYVAADGQELSQLTYPVAAQALADGLMPQVTNDVWLSNPTTRGCYVANSSQGKFRVPDYNGKQTGSLGALFLRGDNGQVVNGNIQLDALQGHSHSMMIGGTTYAGISTSVGGTGPIVDGYNINVSAYKGRTNLTLDMYSYSDYGDLKVSKETRPLNVSGCWIIKLFGAVTNAGSADVAQLASDYANVAARVSALESNKPKLTIIYPNDGTVEAPANVAINNRYVLDNPFNNEAVICKAELLISGSWGEPFFSYSGKGVLASQLDNKIVVQTGSAQLAAASNASGNAWGITADVNTPTPCRVKVWRIT